MAEFTGIKPTKTASQKYTTSIDNIVLVPLQQAVIDRLENAQNIAHVWQDRINAAFDDITYQKEVAAQSQVIASDHFEALDAYHAKKMISQMQRVLNVNVKDEMNSTLVKVALSRRIDDNVGLIKSIAPELKQQFNQDFQQLVFQEGGFDQAKILNLLTDRFSVAHSRAELIATDQTGKAIGELTKIRQQDVGFDRFIWRTSEDRRVRPEHVELNNKIFTWEAGAPGVGLPGEPIRCRCIAIPYVPDTL